MKITGNNLKFSRLSAGDFHLYMQLATNELVMRFITGGALPLPEAELRFRKSVESTEINPDAGFFIVRLKEKDTFIGVAKLVQYAGRQYEVGYMLLPGHWGKGYASAMVEYLVQIAKEKTIGELIGIVDPENPASIKVLEKFGFELFETGQIDGLAAAYYKLELLKP
jgi:RimJ/RimL family protein N-acetyltransferase